MIKFINIYFLIFLMMASVACQSVDATAPSNTSTPTLGFSPEPSPTLSATSKTSQGLILTDTTTPTDAPTPTIIELQTGTTMIWEPDGAVMVYMSEGYFIMGSTEDDPEADNDEYPQHEVFLDSFWIDRSEVTNGQYKQCVAANECQAPYPTGSFSREMYYGDPRFANHPVIYVNWYDAVNCCKWAGKRLPTEAEWEKAARGVDGRNYPWGDSRPDRTLANFGENEGDTVEVGSYPEGASPYGVLDMAGNVFEWVKDWYAGDYYALATANNPKGPRSGQERVIRSGAWLYVARRIRAPYRNSRPPEFRDGTIGFRCARSAPTIPKPTPSSQPTDESANTPVPAPVILQTTSTP